MTIRVPYLSEEAIEQDAEHLLKEYEETISRPIVLPVPVEEITTYHLALRLDFADLHGVLCIPQSGDQPDILAAIWVDKDLVLIDHHLNPKNNRSLSGRFRFSVGHEIGHWRLHRSYVARNPDQSSLFDGLGEPAVICRASQAAEPIEWQANFYSSCLLMPRAKVFEEWESYVGHRKGLLISELCRTVGARSIANEVQDSNYPLDVNTLDKLAKPIAKLFDVSPQAMRIRLEKLGLLLREPPCQAVLGIRS